MASNASALESQTPLPRRSDRINRRRDVKWQQWPETTSQQNQLDAEWSDCSLPDLEDGSLISWGFQQSQNATGEGVVVDVLYGNGTDLHWPRDIDDDELSRIMELPAHSLRVCFINTLKTDNGWLPGNFDPRQRTIRILRKAGLSGVLLCNLYSEQSYWAKMGNQRYMRYDNHGQLKSLEICYQYRCGWDTGVSFIHAVREKQQTTYFCINYPSGARDRLEALFRHEKRRSVIHRDFFLDTLVADDSLKQWQFDIGQRRLVLLQFEKTFEKPLVDKSKRNVTLVNESNSRHDVKGVAVPVRNHLQRHEKNDIEHQPRSTTDKRPRFDTDESYTEQFHTSLGRPGSGEGLDFDSATQSLHKMVRHWLGLRQDCEDLLAQLRFLHETYVQVTEKRGKEWPSDLTTAAGESFEALISQCDICVRWTQAYHDRTQTRINLLFHLANQRTAADTAKIAEQTQRDSASMITIAAVTMLFLPGTFICAILSTTFFDFGEQGLRVSRQWWVLLAATVPLTIVVFGVWVGWQRMRRQSQQLRVALRKIELQKSAVDM
ncbi:hypothetical protein ST47_g2476 [Ascochyta rabiei]|uniref:Metal ion transmembrane transporter n=1 Tax=Didymella rabiei TaxID=5454 RepID=A0A163JJ74_DIDRA|nr:hypothetical protein ST47_g2476 [Ascochyta rabiei]